MDEYVIHAVILKVLHTDAPTGDVASHPGEGSRPRGLIDETKRCDVMEVDSMKFEEYDICAPTQLEGLLLPHG